MMFDPEDFIKVANDNCWDTCTEAQQRTAVSRLYYAVFLVCREFLSKKYSASLGSGSEVHRNVINKMTEWSPNLAADLKQLRDARNDADYELRLSTEAIMVDYQSHHDNAINIISKVHKERRILGV